MGIFSDNVMKYYEYGLFTIPCGDKKQPIIGNEWQKYCTTPPSQELVEQWEGHFRDVDKMGLLLGPSSNVVAFDFDYDYDEKKVTISKQAFDKDKKIIEAEIARILPLTPCEKVGKKGWTKFYRWNKGLQNVSADKNNVRLFDFLAMNKQTIIPPSFYGLIDKKHAFYRWSGTPITDCLDDLPEIDQDCVDELKHFLSDKTSELGGRHGELVSWLFSVLKFEKNLDKAAKKLIERDLKNNPDRPYFSSDHFKSKDPFKNARALTERVFKYKTAHPRTSDKLRQFKYLSEDSYDSFEYFFDEELEGAVREKLSKELKIKDEKGMWQPVIAKLDSLKSRAHTASLDHAFTQIHLSEYENRKPLELLISPSVWDGQERLLKIFSKFKFKENALDIDIAWDLFKDWCANIFRRADNSMNQNRILIFRGPQGIGKDYFIENVIGKALGPYFINLEPTDSNKDNFAAIHGKLLANISEFDQTSKLAIASLKNLITASSQRLRLSYDRRHLDYSFHCSFFASCNFDSILRDSSGNRRFIIFDIENIDKTYDEFINPDQILAEIYQWYKNDFSAKASSFEALKKFVESETPDNPDDLILESLVSLIKPLEEEQGEKLKSAKINLLFNEEKSKDYVVRYSDIEESVSRIAKTFGVSVFRVQGIMKRRGLQFHNGVHRHYSVRNLVELTEKSVN